MGYFKFSNDLLEGRDFFTHLITDDGNLHSHEFYEFSYVVKGNVMHRVSKNEYTYLTNDTLVVLKPNAIHSFNEENISGHYHRDIIASKQFLKSICKSISDDTFSKIEKLPPITYVNLNMPTLNFLETHLSYFNTVQKIDKSLANSIKYFTMYIILNLILASLESSNKSTSSEVYTKLLTTLTLPTVLEGGLPVLIKEMNYSHGHLNRIVKEHSGKNIFAILTKYRMLHATTLLKTTDLSIGDIAATVGYNSISHFTDAFKKETGLSPAKYKNNEFSSHEQRIIIQKP